jgi:hypothetical protein
MTNGVLTPTDLLGIFPEQTISNHPNPLLSFIKRTVKLGGFAFNTIINLPGIYDPKIVVYAIVKHYDSSNNYIPTTVADTMVIFYADTQHYIDPTSPTVARVTKNDDGSWAANSVRELDAYISMFDQPQTIFNVINAQLLAQDAKGAYADIYQPVQSNQLVDPATGTINIWTGN